MKQNRNGGYSLIEILLAIVLLGAIMVPTCTSLVMSIKINDRTDEMMQAQLAVSSAVETLMAEGVSAESVEKVKTGFGVDITSPATAEASYYEITVTSADGKVSVTTYIRSGGGGA